jgi:hypothetical protein
MRSGQLSYSPSAAVIIAPLSGKCKSACVDLLVSVGLVVVDLVDDQASRQALCLCGHTVITETHEQREHQDKARGQKGGKRSVPAIHRILLTPSLPADSGETCALTSWGSFRFA